MNDLNIVISTSHRNWAIGALAKNIQIKINLSRTEIIEFPQSRRQLKSFKGFLFFPNAKVNLFMHQDLAIIAFDKKWVKSDSINIIRYTHNNKEINEYRSNLSEATYILVENSDTKNEMVKMGIDRKKIMVLPHPIEVDLFLSLIHI